MSHPGWLMTGSWILMAYEIIPKYNWVVCHPLYKTTNRGELNTALVSFKRFTSSSTGFGDNQPTHDLNSIAPCRKVSLTHHA